MIMIDKARYNDAARSLGIKKPPVVTIRGSGRLFLGSHWPKSLVSFRYPGLDAKGGSIVRVANSQKSSERKNITLAHELVHESQSRCKKLFGKTIELSVSVTLALLGFLLGTGIFTSVIYSLIGLTLGLRLGWLLAPHEIEARRLAPRIAKEYKMITYVGR